MQTSLMKPGQAAHHMPTIILICTAKRATRPLSSLSQVTFNTQRCNPARRLHECYRRQGEVRHVSLAVFCNKGKAEGCPTIEANPKCWPHAQEISTGQSGSESISRFTPSIARYAIFSFAFLGKTAAHKHAH